MRNIMNQNKLGVILIGIALALIILVLIGMTNTLITYTLLGTGIILGAILYIKTMYKLIKQIRIIIKDKAESQNR